jgi:hypothetical protein
MTYTEIAYGSNALPAVASFAMRKQMHLQRHLQETKGGRNPHLHHFVSRAAAVAHWPKHRLSVHLRQPTFGKAQVALLEYYTLPLPSARLRLMQPAHAPFLLFITLAASPAASTPRPCAAAAVQNALPYHARRALCRAWVAASHAQVSWYGIRHLPKLGMVGM